MDSKFRDFSPFRHRPKIILQSIMTVQYNAKDNFGGKGPFFITHLGIERVE